MTLAPAVATLIGARRIEQVPADRPSALVRLARAEDKLEAARKIATIDVEVAYVTAYDATRIAVTAHMLATGYRVRAVAGAHEAVGIYAEAMIVSPSSREFQRMRRRRNKSEYDDVTIGRADLAADLAHADAIIRAHSRCALIAHPFDEFDTMPRPISDSCGLEHPPWRAQLWPPLGPQRFSSDNMQPTTLNQSVAGRAPFPTPANQPKSSLERARERERRFESCRRRHPNWRLDLGFCLWL